MGKELTIERLVELQGYLQKSLESFENAMNSARKAAGYRAIVAPQDTDQLRDYQNQYNVANEARVYINILLANFPELDKK